MAGRQASNIYTRSRRGLTLIELLVIISIIALMVSIILPALSKARSRATAVVCMSNLRQYGSIGLTYLSDHDGFFLTHPDEWLYTAESYNAVHPKGCRWHDREMAVESELMRANKTYQGAFWREVVDMSLGPCPTFRRFGGKRGCENPGHPHKLDIDPQASYSINGYLGGARPGSIERLSQARKTSSVFFFAEENAWSIPNVNVPKGYLKRSGYRGALSTTALDDTVLVITPSPDVDGCFATYHNTRENALDSGASNVAFLDGHVEIIWMEDQLRRGLNGGDSKLGPAGNLHWAWAGTEDPPGGWEAQ
ncbi:MAG: type II secretion system protein [Sedimentisphaerales bacterium]|nr:type II secretion system protein [Sedimentisphaerales bacterium]